MTALQKIPEHTGHHLLEIRENKEQLVDLSFYPFVSSPEYHKMGFTRDERMFLREGVAEKLVNIQSNKLGGLKFKIWDGWRSRAVQQAIYDDYYQNLKQENPDWDEQKLDQAVLQFVAKPDDPDFIPHHATGGAVDLTLIDENGEELNMGTGFDHFGPESTPEYFHTQNNLEISKNRNILFEVMASEGFVGHPREWWHYDFGNQRWALLSGHDFAYYGEVKSIN